VQILLHESMSSREFASAVAMPCKNAVPPPPARERAQKFSSGAAQQGARWLLELLYENGIKNHDFEAGSCPILWEGPKMKSFNRNPVVHFLFRSAGDTLVCQWAFPLLQLFASRSWRHDTRSKECRYVAAAAIAC
jgi:hypothetical protein